MTAVVIGLIVLGVITLGCLLVWLMPDPYDYDPPRCHGCGQPMEY